MEKMEKHVHLLSILWIVYGCFSLLAGFIVFGLLFGLSFLPDIEPDAPYILRAFGIGIGAFLWMLAIPKIIAGIGLMKNMEWSRILTLILAFLSLLNFPLGTALGIYSFVILLKDESIQLFKSK